MRPYSMQICGTTVAILLALVQVGQAETEPLDADETAVTTPADLPSPSAPSLITDPVVDGPLALDSLPEPLPDSQPLGDEPPGTVLTEDDLTSLQTMVPFGYRLRQNELSWLVGDGDQFGMFSLESFATLEPGKTSGLVTGTGFHFLNGPVRTDLPPRLLDFLIGWQVRKQTGEFGYDVAARVGAFSDFEGSARQGIRYPSHAVGYYRWLPGFEFVLGIDYLDRDDIAMLPVAGLILTPHDDIRLELVFPRPVIEVRLSAEKALYVAGELGGGTWDIERPNQPDDVITYRDLRLVFGISTRGQEGSTHGFEVGYVFDRDLSYRSGSGDYSPGAAFLIRSTHLY